MMDFSANAYLDMYLRHVQTLRGILAKQPPSYHIIMKQIYVEAR